MMESIENEIQLLLTAVCAGIAGFRAVRSGSREWALLSFFAGAYFLGNLYWLLYLVFYGNTPEFALIPDLGWYSSLLFLLLLLVRVNEKTGAALPGSLWAVAAFPAAMCAFYMQWGQAFSNLVYAFLMTLLLRRAVGGLLSIFSIRKNPEGRSGREFYSAVLLFCGLEYGLWTSSCFWDSTAAGGPYFWLDVLLSVSFLLFLPALRKAVEG